MQHGGDFYLVLLMISANREPEEADEDRNLFRVIRHVDL